MGMKVGRVQVVYSFKQRCKVWLFDTKPSHIKPEGTLWLTTLNIA